MTMTKNETILHGAQVVIQNEGVTVYVSNEVQGTMHIRMAGLNAYIPTATLYEVLDNLTSGKTAKELNEEKEKKNV